MTNSGSLRRGSHFIPAPRPSIEPLQRGLQTQVHILEFLEQAIPRLRDGIQNWADDHCEAKGSPDASSLSCPCDSHQKALSTLRSLREVVRLVSRFIFEPPSRFSVERAELAGKLMEQYQDFLRQFWDMGFRYARGDSLPVSLAHCLGRELAGVAAVLEDREIELKGQAAMA